MQQATDENEVIYLSDSTASITKLNELSDPDMLVRAVGKAKNRSRKKKTFAKIFYETADLVKAVRKATLKMRSSAKRQTKRWRLFRELLVLYFRQGSGRAIGKRLLFRFGLRPGELSGRMSLFAIRGDAVTLYADKSKNLQRAKVRKADGTLLCPKLALKAIKKLRKRNMNTSEFTRKLRAVGLAETRALRRSCAVIAARKLNIEDLNKYMGWSGRTTYVFYVR